MGDTHHSPPPLRRRISAVHPRAPALGPDRPRGARRLVPPRPHPRRPRRLPTGRNWGFESHTERGQHPHSPIQWRPFSYKDDSRWQRREHDPGSCRGLRVSSGIVGACGDDDQGRLFCHNMSLSGVDLSRLRAKKGPTGQCVCLVDANGNRTMRPCLSNVVKLQTNELKREDFRGSKWLVVRYAYFNSEPINAAIKIAKQEGVSISLDLASFEMVRDYRSHLIELLETGNIDLCFANEDEARELIRGEATTDPEVALEFLAKYCKWAVVTLGSKGCVAKHGKEVVRVPAIGESHAVDATGAGDLFASGFLYGLVKGLSLEECCKVGACSGGSVIRALGGEVMPENWQWMYKQMKAKGLSVPDLGIST
uniref:Carbohydrate kinase PfkB domain-containing protein n=1 Tax=Ananas comosus var. bracteatus TaxID=296719 RepID=A0A6V7QI63_ANACO|nr:unnamed protein product [Ananas comosus var. bracteatus]